MVLSLLLWALGCDSSSGPGIVVPRDDAPSGDLDAASPDGAGPDASSSPCAVRSCDDTGACEVLSTVQDGMICGHGACGTVLRCQAGECTPEAPVCDDGDPCTDDTCSADGTCSHAPRTGGELHCGVGECANINVQCLAGKLQTCTPKEATVEICDGKDNDCDGTTDNGIAVQTCGKGVCAVTVPGCANGKVPECVPNAAAATTETCNGKDDDCDGIVDNPGTPGCQPYLRDDDQDGYSASATEYQCLCSPTAPYTALVAGDCDDKDASVHPGATEVCNGKDDDCNGLTDEPGALDCTLFYADKDGDGHGDAADSACLCAGDAAHPIALSDDCDDTDATIYPGAVETCNGRDDNCNGQTDEEGADGCLKYYLDEDQDGYGVTSDTDFHCICKGQPLPGKYTTTRDGDCCDKDSRAHPNQWSYFTSTNLCGTWDYDCNGYEDKEYPDWGGCRLVDLSCNPTSGFVNGTGNCGEVAQFLISCTWDFGACDQNTQARTRACR